MDITRRRLQHLVYDIAGPGASSDGDSPIFPRSLISELDRRQQDFDGQPGLLSMLTAIGEEIDAEPDTQRRRTLVKNISRTRVFAEIQKQMLPHRVALIKKRQSMTLIPKMILEKAGFEVECWLSVEEFVASGTWPDCIVSGWFFDSGMNASCLLKRIELIPVIIISGLPEYEAESLELGAYEFQHGTYGERALADSVRRAVNIPMYRRECEART